MRVEDRWAVQGGSLDQLVAAAVQMCQTTPTHAFGLSRHPDQKWRSLLKYPAIGRLAAEAPFCGATSQAAGSLAQLGFQGGLTEP